MNRYIAVNTGMGWRVGEHLSDGTIMIIAEIVRRTDLPSSTRDDNAQTTAHQIVAALNWTHEMSALTGDLDPG